MSTKYLISFLDKRQCAFIIGFMTVKDAALVSLDNAQRALSECKNVMQAKKIMDAAEAARIYLARTHASLEAVNHATEIRTLAERQMGEFLATTPKNGGHKFAGGKGPRPPAEHERDFNAIAIAALPQLLGALEQALRDPNTSIGTEQKVKSALISAGYTED